jgi:hypothetical protein
MLVWVMMTTIVGKRWIDTWGEIESEKEREIVFEGS